MRTETRTVRIGECVGPVDWTYDFAGHCSSNRDYFARTLEAFEELARGVVAGERWEATTDGGWPRVGWGAVTQVGMYDGWPYWRPVPSFYLSSWLGGSWHAFSSLSEARKAANPSPEGTR